MLHSISALTSTFLLHLDMCIMTRKLTLIIALFISAFSTQAQSDPFQIHLEPLRMEGLPGIQAYAWGQHDGLWLIVGGRIDGLHRRQPWATFNPEGRNIQLTVVDPAHQKIWTSPLTSLSIPLQDQLSSTNMEFHQDGNTLYLVGGYGHSQTIDAKVTYAMLTAIDMPSVIMAVINGQDLSPYVKTMTDPRFAVTGGHLHKINETYFLVGGQKFDGNYNPMNHPSFTQEYINGFRRFQLENDGTSIKVTQYTSVTDTAAFHRRDYNVAPLILPDGQEGLMSYSGPFQLIADLPYLNVVSIDQNKYTAVPGFAQYYCNYHSAVMPMYSSADQAMHTIFFGGIAQYADEDGKLVEDSDVPFVKTISRVTQDAQGMLTEYKLSIEMPGYLGASAEFIPASGIPRYDNGVIKLDQLRGDSMLVGYVYGGIESTAANIFWINDSDQSVAHPVAYKVYVVKRKGPIKDQLNVQSHNGLQLQIFPTSGDEMFNILFTLSQKSRISVTISDEKGKVVLKEDWTNQVQLGANHFIRKVKPFTIGEVYAVTMTVDGKSATQYVRVKA